VAEQADAGRFKCTEGSPAGLMRAFCHNKYPSYKKISISLYFFRARIFPSAGSAPLCARGI
jgi:hypothetical protein